MPPKPTDNIVKTADGQPIVPFGTQAPMSQAPKDTLPRPTPTVSMPAQNPVITQEAVQNKAVESTSTFEELSVKKGFKTPDDLAKAYAHLESQSSRVTATLAEAIKARSEFQNPFNDPAPVKTEEAQTPEDAIKIVHSMINKQVQPLKDQMEYELYLIRNPSEAPLAPEAIRYVKENPGIKWDVAFKAARADHIGEVREQGKQEAYQSIQSKAPAATFNSSQRAPDATVQDLIGGIKSGKIPLTEAKRLINGFVA